MQVSVIQSRQYGQFTYTISLIDAEPGEYRARLFMYYPGMLLYSGDNGVGLSVRTPDAIYDDWNSAFRPPRIDSHKFNTEIVVPLSEALTTIEFIGTVDESSESYIGSTVINPVNVLIERKISPADISFTRFDVEKNKVTFESNYDFADDTAVTINYAGYTSKHLLGPDGMRIFGTYRVHRNEDGSYSYQTEHYSEPNDVQRLLYTTYRNNQPVTIAAYNAQKYRASVWEVCYYSCGSVTLSKLSAETAQFSCSQLPPLQAGDTVCLDGYSARVLSNDGQTVTVSAVLTDNTVNNVSCMYCPRVPSNAVPVNWPSVTVGDDVVTVENSTEYDHTVNTYKANPIVDTYFSRDEYSATHNSSEVLVCGCGKNEAVTCMQFAPNAMESDNATAELVLYVNDMNCSEATIVLYQMESAGWSPIMDYDTIAKYITDIPIGSYTLKNPAMKHVNEATNIPAHDMGDYGNQIHIPIDSEVLAEWLSGTASYSPSIAVKVVGEGSPSVSFSSSDCGNVSKAPYILFTCGEQSALNPDPFDIEMSASTVVPGQVLRITPADPSVNTFGNSIFSDKVMIGEGNAPIVAGDPTYIDVYVPEINGNANVMVYRKASSTGRDIPLTTGDTYVYVKSDNIGKSVKLAEKKEPGVVDMTRVGATALYNRDMGFNNITEVTDETSLIQNVYSILLTNPGERLFSQNFGTGITERLFKLGSQAEGLALLQECIQKVNLYEPRVHIDGDQSSCEFDNSENRYYLLLCCVLPSARTEYIKLPFKNRGRMV